MSTPDPMEAAIEAAARAVAEDRAVRWAYSKTLGPGELADFVDRHALEPNLLADLRAAASAAGWGDTTALRDERDAARAEGAAARMTVRAQLLPEVEALHDRLAAYEGLVTAARAVLGALERLPLSLPRQGGKTALFDAYWGLRNALPAEGPASPGGEVVRPSPECMIGGRMCEDCDNDLGCDCECHAAAPPTDTEVTE